jgi:cytochrome c oxidase subunit II
MRKSMRRSLVTLALAVTGGFLLSLAPTMSAQRAKPREHIIIVEPLVPGAGVLLVASTALGFPDAPRRIDITPKKFSYAPDKIDLKKGEPVVLVFHSRDVTHGFDIPDLNIKVNEIKKGEDSEVSFTPTQAGHFVGKCAHYCGTGHGSMTLQINVEE